MAGLAGGAMLAAVGQASAADRITLNVASAYPGNLPQLGTLGRDMTKRINAVTGGSIRAKFFEPKALVPPAEMFDAISSGALDAAWSTPGYWYGKEKALALFASVPFGPQAGEYLAWMYFGGGQDMMQKIYAKYNIHSLICGVIAPEASGWFRKEINSVEDLKGLKMRFFGLGAKVMEKMGVSTQLLHASDIYPALERGAIDATEFSMPAIDLKLGFYQVAKHYYFPGWHQQSTLFDLMISKKKWDAMDETQHAQIEAVCGDNIRHGLAEGEAIQVAALKELQSKGVHIHRWPQEILDKLEAAWNEVVAEHNAEDATFKEAWDSYSSFRENYKIWKDLGYL
ncbi:MAG: TRAP transporter substrate-binding protein [Rhodobacterales bacterium]|nr:TRAP transporter substrate-binding protein [Rhodobacterales bacterium]